MVIKSRKFNQKEDFDNVRSFLLHTYTLTRSLVNWLPDRFENSCKFNKEDIRIWEKFTEKDSKNVEIVGIANSEYERVFYIQIHPNYKYLEREIVNWIENHCYKTKKDKSKSENLYLFSLEGDKERESLLSELGYENRGVHDYNRIRPLNLSIPSVETPEGFIIRNFEGRPDYDNYREAIRQTFNHNYVTEDVLDYLTKASFYIQDLDLLVIAPDETIAAFCTLRTDPVAKTMSLEPMGTLPKYRRLGLARILLFEALKRAKKYNPSLIYIGGAADTPEANKFYDSVGFTIKVAQYKWCKRI